MTQDELERFTDVMVQKCELLRQDDEGFRNVIQQVIVDTELLVTGAVPIERWLDDAWVEPASTDDVTLPADYWETAQ